MNESGASPGLGLRGGDDGLHRGEGAMSAGGLKGDEVLGPGLGTIKAIVIGVRRDIIILGEFALRPHSTK